MVDSMMELSLPGCTGSVSINVLTGTRIVGVGSGKGEAVKAGFTIFCVFLVVVVFL